MKHFYPIVLKNKKLKPIKLSSNIEIRRLSNTERVAFFGLKKVEFSFSGRKPIGHIGWYKFTPSKKSSKLPYQSILGRGTFDNSSDILASNYVVVMDIEESPDFLIDKLNLSFALFEPTSTGCYIGFRENENDVHFHYNMRLGRPYDYLKLKVEDPIKIKELFKLVSDNYKDKRFKLFSELYLRSLEGGKIGLDLRFLLLIMALENLYLPGKNQELSFRLSVKVANIISKYGYGKPKENYKIIREIYDVRSSLVHNGKTNKLDNRIFSVLTSIVRISLIIYLRNKNLFSESKPIEEIIFQ